MTSLTTISEGASGQPVEWAQYLLFCQTDLLSYRQIDGIFGPQTKAAMEQFQLISNLTVDGVVGRPPGRSWAATVRSRRH